MTVGPGSCVSEISMTMELLSITISHQVFARPSNWRIAIYNFWSSKRVGCAWKYVDMLRIHESTTSPFIWPKNLGSWTFTSNWSAVGGGRCCIWINWCSASAKSCVGMDMLAEVFSSVGSHSYRGGNIFISRRNSKTGSLDVLACLMYQLTRSKPMAAPEQARGGRYGNNVVPACSRVRMKCA